jgi:hypothetical protein
VEIIALENSRRKPLSDFNNNNIDRNIIPLDNKYTNFIGDTMADNDDFFYCLMRIRIVILATASYSLE